MSNKAKFALIRPTHQLLDNRGLKHWTESTKRLSDILFDGSPQNLKMF